MTKLTFHTEERDEIKKMTNRYKCSPFTGKCYTDDVSLVRDKKTGFYHIILTENQAEKIIEKFVSKKPGTGGPYNIHMLMTMIQPIDEDKDFLIFRSKE